MRKVGGVDDAIWTLPPEDRGREGRPNTGQWAVVIVLAAVIALGVVYPAMAAVLSRKDYGTFGFWKVPEPDRLLRSEVLRQRASTGEPCPVRVPGQCEGRTLELLVVDFQRTLDLRGRGSTEFIELSVHDGALYPDWRRRVGDLAAKTADHDSNPGVRDRRPARVSRHSSRTGDPLVTASVTIPNARSSGASASASSCPEAVIPRARSTRSGLHRSYSSTRSPRGLRPMRSRIGSSDAKALWAPRAGLRPAANDFGVRRNSREGFEQTATLGRPQRNAQRGRATWPLPPRTRSTARGSRKASVRGIGRLRAGRVR